MIRVTVWNEFLHEVTDETVRVRYPNGIHGAIRDGISELLGEAASVRTATLADPEHGLTADVLSSTDVLAWWGHAAHDSVDDEIVETVHDRVLAGMGLIVLHSGHFSKPFKRLMGTTCALRWRCVGERELVWCVNPSHPIAKGVSDPIVIPEQEMYGEPFDIPQPDDLIFVSSFAGGEVFRSGCCFYRGRGRIFYFSPGDQAFPVYYHADVRRVIANAVQWAAPQAEVSDPMSARHEARIGWFNDGVKVHTNQVASPSTPSL